MKLNIKYTLTAPLSHIGETASTGSYFQSILTQNGKLPVITANSIRGQIRDSGAKYLLDTIGAKVDKDVFHVLFSGGNLSGTMKNDIEKARMVREIFPMVSILGGGLGDIILSGKSNFTFAYPICSESEEITKIKSQLSWHKLIEEIEFTRTDDSKDDKLSSYLQNITEESTGTASTQMRYSVQYIAAGTEFIQTIYLFENTTDLEKGALLSAMAKWFETPILGGMASKGFGYFDADVNNGSMSVKDEVLTISPEYADYINKYNLFLKDKDFETYFHLLKKGGKNAKTKNSTIKSDSQTN